MGRLTECGNVCRSKWCYLVGILFAASAFVILLVVGLDGGDKSILSKGGAEANPFIVGMVGSGLTTGMLGVAFKRAYEKSEIITWSGLTTIASTVFISIMIVLYALNVIDIEWFGVVCAFLFFVPFLHHLGGAFLDAKAADGMPTEDENILRKVFTTRQKAGDRNEGYGSSHFQHLLNEKQTQAMDDQRSMTRESFQQAGGDRNDSYSDGAFAGHVYTTGHWPQTAGGFDRQPTMQQYPPKRPDITALNDMVSHVNTPPTDRTSLSSLTLDGHTPTNEDSTFRQAGVNRVDAISIVDRRRRLARLTAAEQACAKHE